jgi:hypothetical protein
MLEQATEAAWLVLAVHEDMTATPYASTQTCTKWPLGAICCSSRVQRLIASRSTRSCSAPVASCSSSFDPGSSSIYLDVGVWVANFPSPSTFELRQYSLGRIA